jgi:hypothetical protein
MSKDRPLQGRASGRQSDAQSLKETQVSIIEADPTGAAGALEEQPVRPGTDEGRSADTLAVPRGSIPTVVLELVAVGPTPLPPVPDRLAPRSDLKLRKGKRSILDFMDNPPAKKD